MREGYQYNKLHDWYWIRPGCTVENGEMGVDYFESTEKVIEYLQQPAKKKARKTERQIENDSSPKKPSRSKAKTSSAPPKKTAPKKKKKQWWFHNEPIPSFREVWSILRDKLHFNYAGGVYKLPYGPEFFASDLDMRCYMAQHGIPNLDLADDEDRLVLERWVTFANVPVKDTNSTIKLENIQEWSDQEASRVLEKKLGFVKKPNGAYHRGTEVYESLRRFVSFSAEPEPSMAPPADGKRRNQKSITLGEQDVLGLRLWAALIKRPLPTFPPNETEAEPKDEKMGEEESTPATDDDNKSSSVVSGTPDDTSESSQEASPNNMDTVMQVETTKETSVTESQNIKTPLPTFPSNETDARTEKEANKDTCMSIQAEPTKEANVMDWQDFSFDNGDDKVSNHQDAHRITMGPGDIVPMTQPMNDESSS